MQIASPQALARFGPAKREVAPVHILLAEIMKMPPFGKALAERLAFHNPPLFIVVCIGLNAWARAKVWNVLEPRAMVLPPDAEPHTLSWPVRGVNVVIDASIGPSEQQIAVLALTLLRAGSLPVTCVSESRSHPFRKFQWSEKT